MTTTSYSLVPTKDFFVKIFFLFEFLEESTDEPSKRAVLLLKLLDSDDEPQESSHVEENEKRERKKSQGVTFNELVERIDIETDPVRDSDTDLRR